MFKIDDGASWSQGGVGRNCHDGKLVQTVIHWMTQSTLATNCRVITLFTTMVSSSFSMGVKNVHV